MARVKKLIVRLDSYTSRSWDFRRVAFRTTGYLYDPVGRGPHTLIGRRVLVKFVREDIERLAADIGWQKGDTDA